MRNEYKKITHSNKWEYKETEFDDISISFIDYLNNEGNDRWELISHTMIDDVMYCLFKRCFL